jgi:activator of 2-hydroxyglutaryl-CoA dehydratase
MSNICAVFAQSEIVNLVSRGHQLADIIKSVEVSIISRIGGLIDRVGKKEVVMFCGGVAQNVGIVRELEKKVNSQLYLPEHVEYVGAIGAALFAIERE